MDGRATVGATLGAAGATGVAGMPVFALKMEIGTQLVRQLVLGVAFGEGRVCGMGLGFRAFAFVEVGRWWRKYPPLLYRRKLAFFD
jgi:hypothetical protein